MNPIIWAKCKISWYLLSKGEEIPQDQEPDSRSKQSFPLPNKLPIELQDASELQVVARLSLSDDFNMQSRRDVPPQIIQELKEKSGPKDPPQKSTSESTVKPSESAVSSSTEGQEHDAQKSTSESAEKSGPKVNITVVDRIGIGNVPQKNDVEFAQMDGYRFEFVESQKLKAVNFWGKARIYYKVFSTVSDTLIEETSQAVGDFRTEIQIAQQKTNIEAKNKTVEIKVKDNVPFSMKAPGKDDVEFSSVDGLNFKFLHSYYNVTVPKEKSFDLLELYNEQIMSHGHIDVKIHYEIFSAVEGTKPAIVHQIVVLKPEAVIKAQQKINEEAKNKTVKITALHRFSSDLRPRGNEVEFGQVDGLKFTFLKRTTRDHSGKSAIHYKISSTVFGTIPAIAHQDVVFRPEAIEEAQKKIDEEAKNKTVKIKVKDNVPFSMKAPGKDDVEFSSVDGLNFKFLHSYYNVTVPKEKSFDLLELYNEQIMSHGHIDVKIHYEIFSAVEGTKPAIVHQIVVLKPEAVIKAQQKINEEAKNKTVKITALHRFSSDLRPRGNEVEFGQVDGLKFTFLKRTTRDHSGKSAIHYKISSTVFGTIPAIAHQDVAFIPSEAVIKAQKKIDAEVKNKTVKIKVINRIGRGKVPQENDVEFSKVDGLDFTFIRGATIDHKGQSEIDYKISSTVEDTVVKTAIQVVGDFRTQTQVAQQKIDDEVKNKTVKITLKNTWPISSTHPLQARDVEFGKVDGLKFTFKGYKLINTIDSNQLIDAEGIISDYLKKTYKKHITDPKSSSKISKTSNIDYDVSRVSPPKFCEKVGVYYQVSSSVADIKSPQTYQTVTDFAAMTALKTQEKIDAEAEHPTVKIKVINRIGRGKVPQENDVEFGKMDGLEFTFRKATAVNYVGKSIIYYKISSTVKGTVFKEIKRVVSGFFDTPSLGQRTSVSDIKTLKRYFRKYFGKVLFDASNVLAMVESPKAAKKPNVYALIFSDIQTEQADEAGNIVLPYKLLKSQANGMFTEDDQEQIYDNFSLALDSADSADSAPSTKPENQLLVLSVKKIAAGPINSIFTGGNYRVGKTAGGVIFRSCGRAKDVLAFRVPRQQLVSKQYLMGKKFLLEELNYSIGDNYPNYRFLLFPRSTGRPRWEFQYHNHFYIEYKDGWFVKQTDTHERKEMLWQDMEWEFNPETGKIHAWVDKTDNKINIDWLYYQHGTVCAGKDSSCRYTRDSKATKKKGDYREYPWIKDRTQFSLQARISWSYTEQGKLILRAQSKPADWESKGAFWFIESFEDLSKLEGSPHSELHRQVTLRQSSKWGW